MARRRPTTSRPPRSRSSTSPRAHARSSPARPASTRARAWLPDGSLLYVSDADGWFQVVRLTADGHDRIVLTAGEREHGEPSGGVGYAPLPSPDGTRFVHIEVHDGLCDLVVGDLAGSVAPKRGRGRPPKVPRTVAAAGAVAGSTRGTASGAPVGWLSDGAWVAAVGESETRPEDLWLLPVPGVAPDDARPRRVTDSMPAVLGAALASGRVPAGERVAFAGARRPAPRGHALAPRARDGQARRPARPDDRLPARRTDLAVVPQLPAVQAAPGRGRVRLPRHRLPRVHRLRAGVPPRQPRRVGPRRRERRHRRRAAGPPSSPGPTAASPSTAARMAATSCCSALVEEPALWRAGVDLFGDSEIAESFRHGDRPGRLDLQRMMGSPDDAARAAAYRRGSPVYRAERIEAPLLILHGRKDKRVVPL